MQIAIFLLSCLSVCLAKSPKPRYHHQSSSSSSNSSNDCESHKQCAKPHWDKEAIQLFPDVGSYPFHFGKAGPACQNFFVSSTQSTYLYAFDCFCNGDAFMILLNGQPVPTEGGLDCPAGSAACGTYLSDPQACALSTDFCRTGWVLVPPGVNNVTISTLVSPYSFGQGYIALFSGCGEVPCCALGSIEFCNFNQVQLTHPYCE